MDSFTRNNSPLIEQQRQRLETLFYQGVSSSEPRGKRWQLLLNQAATALVHWLTAGDAPRINRTLIGETEIWKVYDPVDQRTYYFAHENEVREWLDQRFNQAPKV
jgi:hypothetical protein